MYFTHENKMSKVCASTPPDDPLHHAPQRVDAFYASWSLPEFTVKCRAWKGGQKVLAGARLQQLIAIEPPCLGLVVLDLLQTPSAKPVASAKILSGSEASRTVFAV